MSEKVSLFFESSQASPACPSDESSITVNERVWSIGGMILTGETEVLGEKHYTALVVDV
jgi:hypothetical protein